MDVTLKEAREKAGYSINDVSKILKIRKQYIIDLEEEIYKNIPGQVYIDGYKKLYCEFLNINYYEKENAHVGHAKPFKLTKKIERKYITSFSIFMLLVIVSLYSFVSH
ncbi:helix-turn-helix domain-containing protein [Rickettsiaceae bacterium]|nr:helix-turn-helix domain-containing protein [Rickettsiaceae bacterium]